MANDSAGGEHRFRTGWWLLAVALVTVAAARFNAGLADLINPDPQGADQVREVERFGTGLVYTSGHAVGQVIAMAFGARVATGRRRLAPADRENNRGKTFLAAVRGGAGLGVVNLATALLIGALTGEWLVRSAVHTDYFDPGLLRDPGVVMLLVLGFVGFPLWALVGAVRGRTTGVGRRGGAVLVLAALVALAFISFVHIQLAFLLLGPGHAASNG